MGKAAGAWLTVDSQWSLMSHVYLDSSQAPLELFEILLHAKIPREWENIRLVYCTRSRSVWIDGWALRLSPHPLLSLLNDECWYAFPAFNIVGITVTSSSFFVWSSLSPIRSIIEDTPLTCNELSFGFSSCDQLPQRVLSSSFCNSPPKG
jgi:hypothetical protein